MYIPNYSFGESKHSYTEWYTANKKNAWFAIKSLAVLKSAAEVTTKTFKDKNENLCNVITSGLNWFGVVWF